MPQTPANRTKGSPSSTEAIRNTAGPTAIHLDFWWPSAGTQLAAHLDFATAADMPDDYRAFLRQVGAGGAGRSYGLSTLVRRDGVWCWSGAGAVTDTTRLSLPFSHDDAIRRRLAELEECEPHEEDFADQAAFQGAFRTWDTRWQELDDRQATGAICLCHHGCASYDWLVVSGPARGTMWLDDRATDRGITPRVGDDGTPFGFKGWYVDWLEEAERKACG